MKPAPHILPVIIIAQFLCTSLWFAGNGIMPELILAFKLHENAIAHLTSSVQFGFIIGTLCFAIFSIADRYSPSKVFLICAIIGSLSNLAIIWDGNKLFSLLTIRFTTGFCLAGIYPVGMKIAADYYQKSLGKSLSFLVAALVLGTALPHLLQHFNTNLPWVYTIFTLSGLAFIGGLLIFIFVPDGPYRTVSQKLDFKALPKLFKSINFRNAALGYFGHMWELYTFWVFVPFMLAAYLKAHQHDDAYTSLFAFSIVAVGSLGCIISGYLSRKFNHQKIAFGILSLSSICCLLFPLFLLYSNFYIFLCYMLVWGMLVIADSPLFSTLVAQNAPAHLKGSALTIVNCLGYAITIVSIQLAQSFLIYLNLQSIIWLLAIGPILSFLLGYKKRRYQQ